MTITQIDLQETYQDFHKLVDMTPRKLEAWLNTEESHAVGYKTTDESVDIAQGDIS